MSIINPKNFTGKIKTSFQKIYIYKYYINYSKCFI